MAALSSPFVVSRPPAGVAPKPLTVVLLGWAGSRHRHLAKYAGLLNNSGYCTLAAICPQSAIFSPTVGATRRFATALLERLCTASARDSSIIIDGSSSGDGRPHAGGSSAGAAASLPQRFAVYAFSNGGCFPLEQMDHLIRSDPRFASLADRAAGVVFDSAPCYLHALVGARALGEGRGPLLRALAFLLFLLVVAIMRVLSPGRPQAYWRNMVDLSIGGGKELYLYSTDDPLCDPVKLDALIEERRRRGHAVSARRWERSQHVGHLLCHPKEYIRLLRGFLDGLCAQ